MGVNFSRPPLGVLVWFSSCTILSRICACSFRIFKKLQAVTKVISTFFFVRMGVEHFLVRNLPPTYFVRYAWNVRYNTTARILLKNSKRLWRKSFGLIANFGLKCTFRPKSRLFRKSDMLISLITQVGTLNSCICKYVCTRHTAQLHRKVFDLAVGGFRPKF